MITAGLFTFGAMLTACAERPTVEQLTESILAAEAAEAVSLTDGQARCIAGELLDSDLADETLAGLAENFDTPNVLAADADDAEGVVADAAITCANAE